MGILGTPAGSQQAKNSVAALMELHKSHYFLTLQWGGAEPNRQFHLIKENSPPRARSARREEEKKTEIERLTEKTTPCQPEIEAQRFAAAALLQFQLLATPVVQLVIILDPRATLPDMAFPKKVPSLQLGRSQNWDLSAAKHHLLNS